MFTLDRALRGRDRITGQVRSTIHRTSQYSIMWSIGMIETA